MQDASVELEVIDTVLLTDCDGLAQVLSFVSFPYLQRGHAKFSFHLCIASSCFLPLAQCRREQSTELADPVGMVPCECKMRVGGRAAVLLLVPPDSSAEQDLVLLQCFIQYILWNPIHEGPGAITYPL
jgi:hypothetical protein